MAKYIIYENEARMGVLAGVEKLARTVAITMGPMGKGVILGKHVGAPTITKDGVSVAREVVLEDPVEELGCQLVKEVAGRTADVAGDGTTTATVLAHEIFKRGAELIATGYSPLDFRDGTKWALDRILENINAAKKNVESRDELENIATISANNDVDTGSKIAEAFVIAGWGTDTMGQVTAEALPGSRETVVRHVNGTELKSGYINDGFLVGEADPNECVLEDCYIFVSSQEFTHGQDNPQLFQSIADLKKPVLVIAKDVRQEGLLFLLQNKKQGYLRSVAIKTPVFPKNQELWLSDLAAMVGATVASESTPLSKFSIDDLGFAKRVIVGRNITRIIEPDRDEDSINKKVEGYNFQILAHVSDSERKDLRDRISFLTAKTTVISVGYITELELIEKGDRFEDAIFATRAAIEDGIVAGGGVALLRAALNVDITKAEERHHKAISVLLKSCERPLRQIVRNAEQDDDKIIERILSSDDEWFGYNAATGEFGGMLEMGVIDPAKVAKTALENATSISSLLNRVGAVLAEMPDNPSSWQPPAGWRVPDQGVIK